MAEQTTEIECDRTKQICIEATPLVTGKGTNKSLSVDIENYAKERWDEHEIVTKPRESVAGCVRHIRRFNRAQKSVTVLTNTIRTAQTCKGVEAKEIHLTLSDGFKVYWELYQALKKEGRTLMRSSADMLRALEKKSGK